MIIKAGSGLTCRVVGEQRSSSEDTRVQVVQ